VTPVDKMVDHLRRVQDTKKRTGLGIKVVRTFHIYTVNEKSRKQFPKNVLLVERKLHKTRKEHSVTCEQYPPLSGMNDLTTPTRI